MRILKFSIENYKSLRSISVEPQDLTVLVGANASGKSNLADCIDFVSEVYRHDLEVAIARKGGYENIAHRKQRRSKGAISVEMTILFDIRRSILQLFSRNNLAPITVKAKHLFSFRAKSRQSRQIFKSNKNQ